MQIMVEAHAVTVHITDKGITKHVSERCGIEEQCFRNVLILFEKMLFERTKLSTGK